MKSEVFGQQCQIESTIVFFCCFFIQKAIFIHSFCVTSFICEGMFFLYRLQPRATFAFLLSRNVAFKLSCLFVFTVMFSFYHLWIYLTVLRVYVFSNPVVVDFFVSSLGSYMKGFRSPDTHWQTSNQHKQVMHFKGLHLSL